VRHGRQFVEKPDLKAGSVAFYEGTSNDPEVLEQQVFHAAIRGKGELCVLPEQAIVVTRILEAIYTSAATGKPYYFDQEN